MLGLKNLLKNKIFFWSLFIFSCVVAFLPIKFPNNISDKLLHFLAFMSISVAALFSYKKIKIIIPSMIAYGLLIELVQFFIPNRTPSILDFTSDIIGVGFGLIIFLAI